MLPMGLGHQARMERAAKLQPGEEAILNPLNLGVPAYRGLELPRLGHQPQLSWPIPETSGRVLQTARRAGPSTLTWRRGRIFPLSL